MGNRIRRFFVYVGLGMLLLTSLDGYSQKTLRKHNWYFGSTQNSIRFNRVTNLPTLVNNKAIPFGTGGSAVATDPGNGNLLFYTDGKRIYDVDHKLMLNGDNLLGNENGNSPAAICPVPNQPGKFFVFTNTATYTTPGQVSYTVVDMTRFGSSTFPSPPNGEVGPIKNVPITTLNNVSEGMIMLPHANGEDYWLINHRVGTSTFVATRITQASFTGTFNQTITIGSTPAMTIAAFGYHEGLKKLAAAPQVQAVNALVMDFDETTGDLLFDLNDFIFNSAITTTTEQQAIYDVEWSESGQYLYLSIHGDVGVTADVLQYDYLNQSITLKSVLPSPVFRSYGLQRGPDSLVYHLYQSSAAGPFLLGRLKKPDLEAASTQYEISPVDFAAIDFGGKQFSGYVPKDTVVLRADFSFVGTCQKSATTFHPIISPNADSLTWVIDGEPTSAWSPKKTFQQAGTFHVTMTAHYRGQTQVAEHDVVIRAFPLTLQLEQDVTACRDEFPPPRGTSTPKQFTVPLQVQGGTPASIVWSNGDMGMELTPDSAGYYYVVVTDVAGCSGYAGVNVREYGLQSQQYNKWYFGKNAGIDFTPQPPVALNESAMDAPEGCAIACDRNGDQLFYTDGSTVWGRTHQVIETNIGGNPRASQSAMIIPFTGDETLFYIFTTEDMNGSDKLQLKYSIFDLKANNGAGGIVQKNTFMYLKNTERITATEQMLLVHELGNSTFRAYPIDTVLRNPIYTDIGTNHVASIPRNVDGYMKLGPSGLIAAPLSTPGVSARIELFKFETVNNATTGTVENYHNIDLNDTNGSIYGIEFSSSGKKLFASVRYGSNSSAIYEYAIDLTTVVPTFIQRIPVPADLGAIQIAPNGQVLVAVNNTGANTSLGMITVVDDNNNPTAPSAFLLNGFPLLSGTNSWLGLPNFRQINSNPPQTPGLTISAKCSQVESTFSGSGRDPNIEEYYFSIFQNGQLVAQNDAQNSPGYPKNPEFAVNLPAGTYKVTLRLQNKCDTPLEFSQDFTITPPPINPSRGVPFCNTPSVTLDANPTNVAGLSYQWLTGETTKTLTVTDVGIYAVDITDAVGCKVRGQFIAADSRPLFDLGPDLTICQRENTPALNVRNAGMTIAWTVDGTPNGNTSSIQAVDVSAVRTITYGVRVTDPATNCFREEDKQYTINVAPDPTFTATAASACGANDGSVSLLLTGTAPPGGPYAYFISGPGSTNESGLDAPAGSNFVVNSLGAGTYTAIVRDQINGCTQQRSVGISDAVFNLALSPDAPNCDPVIVSVTLTGPATPSFTYTTTNSSTGATTNGTASTPSFKTTGLTAGTYTIEVKDASNCTRTNDITITPAPRIPVTLTPDLCALTLTATGPTTGTNTFLWTPTADISSGAGTGTIGLVPGNRTVTYKVHVENATVGCPADEEITLNVGNGILPNLTQSTGCTDIVTITAQPTGNFTYYWFVNGATTPDPTLGGQSIIATRAENGNSYVVQVYEPQSGCRRDSGPLSAVVVGEVNALLASTPPCEDDQPITLTATTADPTGATYAWTRDGSTLTDVTTASTQQTQEGTYQVIISKATCSATASLLIDRAPLPQGLLDNRNVICDDDENTDPETKSVDLDPGAFVAYDWSKNGVSLNFTERVLTADSKGKYAVMITDARGCKNKDEIDIVNDCLPRVNAPNAFKPGSNDNFVNGHPELTNADFWVISKFIEDENFKVFIFNRWGELIYSSTDRFFKWNGGYNNDLSKPLPPGTYSYVVQYKSTFRPGEGVKEKRGGVALIR